MSVSSQLLLPAGSSLGSPRMVSNGQDKIPALNGSIGTVYEDAIVDTTNLYAAWFPGAAMQEITAATAATPAVNPGDLVGFVPDLSGNGWDMLAAANGNRPSIASFLDFAMTAVTAGAASATQTVGSTAGMQKGDVHYFPIAAVFRTVSSITSSTVVVYTASVTTTTGETIWHATASSILGGMAAFINSAGTPANDYLKTAAGFFTTTWATTGQTLIQSGYTFSIVAEQSNSAPAAYRFLAGCSAGTNAVAYQASSTNLRLISQNSTDTNYKFPRAASAFPANFDYFEPVVFTMTWDPAGGTGVGKFYANGQLLYTLTKGDVTTSIPAAGEGFEIGNGNATLGYLEQYGPCLVYAGVKTQAQVAAIAGGLLKRCGSVKPWVTVDGNSMGVGYAGDGTANVRPAWDPKTLLKGFLGSQWNVYNRSLSGQTITGKLQGTDAQRYEGLLTPGNTSIPRVAVLWEHTNDLSVLATGAASGSPTTTNIPSNITTTSTTQYVGHTIQQTSGTYSGQTAVITAHTSGANATFTVATFTNAPAAAVTLSIYGGGTAAATYANLVTWINKYIAMGHNKIIVPTCLPRIQSNGGTINGDTFATRKAALNTLIRTGLAGMPGVYVVDLDANPAFAADGNFDGAHASISPDGIHLAGPYYVVLWNMIADKIRSILALA